MSFIVNLLILGILELIFPTKRKVQDSNIKDEWIIMDDFHRDYEKHFDKDNDGDEY